MEGNNKDTGKEKEIAVKKKKKNFFKSNFIVILLILLSGGAIAVNEYDKKNNYPYLFIIPRQNRLKKRKRLLKSSRTL